MKMCNKLITAAEIISDLLLKTLFGPPLQKSVLQAHAR